MEDEIQAEDEQLMFDQYQKARARLQCFFKEEEAHKKYLKRALIAEVVFAVLFTAVVLTFIVNNLHPETEPDPNQVTLAFLCDLAYKTGNKAVCDNALAATKQTGRSPAISQGHAMMYASMMTSVLSIFLSNTGIQWSERCFSIRTARSTIEHDLNRERELDNHGTRDSYLPPYPSLFSGVVAGLLCLCGIFRLLWATNITLMWIIAAVIAFFLVIFFVAGSFLIVVLTLQP